MVVEFPSRQWKWYKLNLGQWTILKSAENWSLPENSDADEHRGTSNEIKDEEKQLGGFWLDLQIIKRQGV